MLLVSLSAIFRTGELRNPNRDMHVIGDFLPAVLARGLAYLNAFILRD